jgi:tRNA(fMet)-specific endonuclease VapC
MTATGAGPLYLLDTNVPIELARGRKMGQAIDTAYGVRAAGTAHLISAVTVGEVLGLAREFGWGASRTASVRTLLSAFVWVGINSSDVLEAYAELDQLNEPNGWNVGQNDLWIAATARVTGATLLTSDKDFDPLEGTFLHRIWIDPSLGKPRTRSRHRVGRPS